MADLDSLEQKVDLDCHFMEMFLGRASSPDIMGQDMSSNKQETLDRALDCFLQMTLGIIDLDEEEQCHQHHDPGHAPGQGTGLLCQACCEHFHH